LKFPFVARPLTGNQKALGARPMVADDERLSSRLSSTQRFVKYRCGVCEHLENGTISLLDLAVHVYLCLTANGQKGSGSTIPPGIVFSSSRKIHALCPKDISERAVRRSLEHLERIGWVRRWAVKGRRGNYPILLARFSVHDVSGNEWRVKAEDTTDWRDPVLIPAADRPRDGHDLSPLKELRSKEGRRNPKTSAAKPVPPTADPRHRVVFHGCYQAFKAKNGQPPTWGKKDAGRLATFLKEHPAMSAEEINRRYTNLLDSTARFFAEKGDSLFYLLNNFDVFAKGPLKEKAGSHGGKLSGSALDAHNFAVAATAGRRPN
jgi:hypothetical protein